MSSQRQIQKKPGSNSYSPPAQKAATWQRPFSDPVYDAVSPKHEETITPRAGFNLMQMRIFPDSPAPVQAKLTVGAPGDKYEQEADGMAAKVMAMRAPENEEPVEGEQKEVQTKPLAEGISPIAPREIAPEESPLQKKTIQRDELTENKPEEEDLVAQKSPAPESIQRDEATAEEKPQEDLLAQKSPAPESIQRDEVIEDKPKEEDLTVQQKATPEGKSSDSGNLESQLNGSKGGGSPLPDEVRAFMEPRFGADFSGVRVHTDSNAVQMNKDLGAQAFAHGSDIYYGAGKSPGKDELTAHELTHTVQQTGNVQHQRADFQEDSSLISKEGSLQRYIDSPSISLKLDNQPIVNRKEDVDKTVNQLTEENKKPKDLDATKAADIGKEALQTVGYDEIIKMSFEAGLLEKKGDGQETKNIQRQPLPTQGTILRQVVTPAPTFWGVFSPYALSAGIASQVDSPVPGPGDIVAVGILAVGLAYAGYTVLSASKSQTQERAEPKAIPKVIPQDRPQQNNVMRFQVQWGTNQGGPTFSQVAIAPANTGVTTVQAIAALNATLALVTPNKAQTAAAPAVAKQTTWIQGRPPSGIATGGYSKSEYFSYKGYTDARVDVENLRGHNLRS